jgi:TolA-binding protein
VTRPRSVRLATLLAVVVGLAAVPPARAEIGFKLPPPDVRGLVPLAALPLDKPPVPAPSVALPAPRQPLPDPPEPALASAVWHRPHATMPVPGPLACNLLGAMGVASQQLDCGRKHFFRGEMEEARTAFQSAVGSGDRLVAREARYWLGETLLRLGRTAEVAAPLGAVAQDDPRGELGVYAQAGLGWLALGDRDAARALEIFDRLLQSSLPAPLVHYARHGRALALYGLKRFPDAQAGWRGLAGQSVPQGLATELNFWVGDTSGRLGDAKNAVPRLRAFTGGSQTFLVEQGLLRHGVWSRAAGEPQEAVRAWRTLLARFPASAEASWARAGLVLALLDAGDEPAARKELAQLEASDKTGTLSRPAVLAVRRWLMAADGRGAEARAFDDELLARDLDPAARAWVLLASAAEARTAGDAAKARDRFDLVRQNPIVAGYAAYAALGLAQLDFEAREFAGAAEQAKQVLTAQSVPNDLRAAALVTRGEAAYWAGDHAGAAEAYRRFLADFGSHPLVPQVRMALGWAEYRQGRHAEAREHWMAFAREAPNDRRAPEALLLAAELAAASDRRAAEIQFREVARRYRGTPHAEVAALNRAVLALADGRAAETLGDLQGLEQRSDPLALAARVRVTRGFALIALKRLPEAKRELTTAVTQSGDALGRLGLGLVAFERADWDEATREWTAARDAGTPGVGQAAEYGLVAVRFNQGKLEEFKREAPPLLARRPPPATAPDLLHALAAVAVEEKRWADARSLALQLADQYPTHEAAPATLGSLSAAAGAGGQWPLAREAHALLMARYPTKAGALTDPVVLGETQLRGGSAAEASRTLSAFVKASPHDPRASRATLLLAEAQEAEGARLAAAETLANFAILNRTDPKRPQALLTSGRLFQEAGRWSEARTQLERAIEAGDGAVLGEAGFRLGEGLRQSGQHDNAVEAYMTAAYLGGDTVWARRGLLGAAQSLSFLNQPAPATGILKKLLAVPDLEPEIAADARRGLKVLETN